MKNCICYLIILASILIFKTNLNAQLSGTYNVPGSYASVAAAVNALNTLGTSGAVTIQINAGYTETAPVGGLTLTTSGTSIKPITFQRTGVGANPKINAYAGGVGTPTTAVQDGIWRFIGCDYVTIDGIDLSDPNLTNPSTMEFGYGFFKASSTNGCQYNTIKNCTVTLNRVNNAQGTTVNNPDGSRAIEFINAYSSSHTSSLSLLASSGSNSFNKVQNNRIENCNIGISVFGFNDAYPYSYYDSDNQIGGSAVTSNTIVNYGGGGFSSYASAVKSINQQNLLVSYNLINNNNGSGVDHTTSLHGIYNDNAYNANVSIANNTITLSGGGSGPVLYPIRNYGGDPSLLGATSNTVSITNNLITNCKSIASTFGSFYGITSNSSPFLTSITGNTITSGITGSGSGVFAGISLYPNYTNAPVNSTLNVSNNNINNITLTSNNISASFRGIDYNTNYSPAFATFTANSLSSIGYTGSGSSTFQFYFIIGQANVGVSTTTLSANSNSISNITVPTNNDANFIRIDADINNINISNNSVVGYFNKSVSGGEQNGAKISYLSGAATTSFSINNNNFSNMTATGTTSLSGVRCVAWPGSTLSLNSNTTTNLNCSNGPLYGIYSLGGSAGSMNDNVVNNLSNTNSVFGIRHSIVGPVTVSGNTINTLYSSAPSNTVYGYRQVGTGGASVNCYKNKIYDLSGETALGIYTIISGTNTGNFYNNLIGDIKSPTGTSSVSVSGFYLDASSTSSLNLYYNSVYLNASSSGANFGSAAIFSSSTAVVNLRNNILINNSTFTGVGKTAVHIRSAISGANYSSSSNNNIFYAGIPGPNNLILSDGVGGYQTLASYKAFVSPADAFSQTENTSFLSTTGSSLNYLHVNPLIISLAESGAVNIAGITDDYDSNIRQGNPGYTGSGSAPDIGADEYNQISVCNTPTPSAIIPNNYSLCSGQSVTLNAVGVGTLSGLINEWKVSTTPGGPYTNVSGGSGASTSSYTSAALSSGVYYYVQVSTCTVTSNAAISNEATVAVNSPPTISITGSASICNGQSNTLTATGANSYTWTGGPTSNSFIVSPSTNSNYSVTGTSAAGCTNTASFSLTIIPNPTVSVSGGSVCAGGTFTLNPSGAVSYTYLPAGPVVSPTTTTVYSVTGTNGFGCISQTPAQATVTINSPSVVVSGTNAICNGTNATLTASGASTYSWSTGSTSGTINVSPSVTTVYTVTGTNSLGCSKTATFSLNVVPVPTITISGMNTLCFGQTTTLTATGGVTYMWENSTTINPRVVSPTTTSTFVVVGTNTLGCAQTTSVVVTVNPLPVVSINGIGSICSGQSTSLTALGASTYTWNTGLQTNTISVSPITTTAYTVSGTNSLGCTNTANYTLSVNPLPVVSISGTNNVCSGQTILLLGSGANSYNWNTGSSASSIFVSPTSNTTYSLVGTNTQGCSNVAVHTVSTVGLPTVNLSVPATPICTNGATVALIGSPSGGIYSGTNVSPGMFTPGATAGTFNATYSYTDSATGCSNTSSLAIVVSVCTGMDGQETIDNNILIYPNPGTGKFKIAIKNNDLKQIVITDLLGRIIESRSTYNTETEFNLTENKAGIYIVTVKTGNLLKTARLIKE